MRIVWKRCVERSNQVLCLVPVKVRCPKLKPKLRGQDLIERIEITRCATVPSIKRMNRKTTSLFRFRSAVSACSVVISVASWKSENLPNGGPLARKAPVSKNSIRRKPSWNPHSFSYAGVGGRTVLLRLSPARLLDR